jgi:hypothetical protein
MAKPKSDDKPAVAVTEEVVDTSFDTEVFEQEALGDDFVSLGTDRLMYKPELCGRRDLRGYLVEAIEMEPSKKDQEPYHLLVFRTTRPTLGVDGDGKTVVPVPVGSEIIIVATERLKRLIPFAMNVEKCPEINIHVIGKIALKNGNEMWRYDAQISRKSKPRAELYSELLPQSETPHVLPAAASK